MRVANLQAPSSWQTATIEFGYYWGLTPKSRFESAAAVALLVLLQPLERASKWDFGVSNDLLEFHI